MYASSTRSALFLCSWVILKAGKYGSSIVMYLCYYLWRYHGLSFVAFFVISLLTSNHRW